MLSRFPERDNWNIFMMFAKQREILLKVFRWKKSRFFTWCIFLLLFLFLICFQVSFLFRWFGIFCCVWMKAFENEVIFFLHLFFIFILILQCPLLLSSTFVLNKKKTSFITRKHTIFCKTFVNLRFITTPLSYYYCLVLVLVH